MNNRITIMKGMLVLMIVLYHYSFRYQQIFNYEWNCSILPLNEHCGRIGVILFFFLSGYLASKRLYDYKSFGIRKSVEYFVNRCWRVYPLYAVSLFIIFAVMILLPVPHREASFTEFIINVLTPIHPGFGYVDGSHWFIAELIRITFFTSFIFCFSKRELCIYVLYLYLAVAFVFNYAIGHSLFIKLYSFLHGEFFLPFIIGMISWKISEIDSIYKKIALLVPVLCIVTIYTITLGGVFLVLTVLIFMTITKTFSLAVKIKPYVGIFVFLGDISFAWYLIHQNIGYSVMYYLQSLVDSDIIIICPITITIILAIGLHYFEKKIPKKILNS